jgi:hypothetical protein
MGKKKKAKKEAKLWSKVYTENINDADAFLKQLNPEFLDSLIRQAVTMCWMMLPEERRTVEAVESEVRRIVDRVLSNLKEDAAAFGITAPAK